MITLLFRQKRTTARDETTRALFTLGHNGCRAFIIHPFVALQPELSRPRRRTPTSILASHMQIPVAQGVLPCVRRHLPSSSRVQPPHNPARHRTTKVNPRTSEHQADGKSRHNSKPLHSCPHSLMHSFVPSVAAKASSHIVNLGVPHPPAS